MHGVKREKKTAATQAAREVKKQKEVAKLQAYLSVEVKFFQLKKAQIKTDESLQHTTHLLTLNPELYTVWNYRREILVALFDQPPSPATSSLETSTIQKEQDIFAAFRESNSDSESSTAEQNKQNRKRRYLEIDLELTEHALRAHPKVYCLWNHRVWCLTQLPENFNSLSSNKSKWHIEMALVDKMLTFDPRNFHGWGYRRYLVGQLAQNMTESNKATSQCIGDSNSDSYLPFLESLSSSVDSETKNNLVALANSELEFCLAKIEANFSNFSAWHQRTKLLPRVWDAKGLDDQQRNTERDVEFELVKQAMYTDPSDQSVWIYHRWLTEQQPTASILEREIQVIEDLLDLEPDSRWCMQSLAHYKSLLIEASSSAEKDALKSQVESLLHQLIAVDPDRQNRYKDLLDGRAKF